MLEISELIIGYLVIIGLSVPYGLLISRHLYPSFLQKSNMTIVFFISILLGLPFLVGILWIVSQLSFSIVTVILIGILSYLVLGIALIRYPFLFSESNGRLSPRVLSTESIVFAILMITSLGYYGITAIYLGWPQVGDPWRVGTMVSLIIENGHIPSTYEPISNNTMGYPLGFPVVCATVSITSGCLPAVSQIIVASLLMGLIPVAIAWWVFVKGKSLFFASLAFLLSFYLHPITVARYGIQYYYLNGTYTVLLSIVIAFAAITAIALTQLTLNSSSILGTFSILAFIFFSCFIVYPSLIFVPGLLMLFWILQQARTGEFVLNLKSIILTLVVVLAFGFVTIAAYVNGLFQFIFDILERSEHLIGYHIPADYFTTGLVGVFFIIAIATSTYRLVKTQNRVFDATFLILIGAVLLSMDDGLYTLGLNILLPTRMVIMLTLWSFAYVAFLPMHISEWANRSVEVTTLHQRISALERGIRTQNREFIAFYKVRYSTGKLSKYIARLLRHRIRKNRSIDVKILSFLIFFALLSPSLVNTTSFTIINQKSWFVRSTVFADDLEGMLYVKKNYSPTDLILNYQSFSELFFPSIGVFNVVFDFESDKDRASELSEIWNDPYNISRANYLISKYNVSVVFLSSVYSVLDTVNFTSGAGGRPLPQTEYSIAFESYDFLEIAFAQGGCIVYTVIKEQL
ncbi:MAG: hypothetical protein ACFFER_04575 [Candidatus Thorarchaeota archaeon]